MLSAITVFALAVMLAMMGVPEFKGPHRPMMPSVNGMPAVMVVPAPLRVSRFGHRRGA
jgi:hypothetical protein